MPESYDAIKLLIGGMVSAGPGQPLADSLAQAQARLMDDPKTSHPYYWAAFIILGDGAKPIIPAHAVAATNIRPAGR